MGKLRDLATGHQWEKIPNDVRIVMLGEDARIQALEARIAKADALAEAHGKLWSALAEIIEAPGMSPNATVRRMAARAEKALVEDSIADVKPVPRFYRESDT